MTFLLTHVSGLKGIFQTSFADTKEDSANATHVYSTLFHEYQLPVVKYSAHLN